MKFFKCIFLLLIALGLFGFESSNHQQAVAPSISDILIAGNPIPIPDVESGKPKRKVRFAWTHHDDNDPETEACDCDGCKIPACPCPIGICVVFGIADNGDPYSHNDSILLAEGLIGTADAWVINSGTQMVISFDQTTAYDDPNSPGNKIIEFNSNCSLPSNLASNLGCTTVTIQQGVYSATFESGYPDGYIVVNVSTT